MRGVQLTIELAPPYASKDDAGRGNLIIFLVYYYDLSLTIFKLRVHSWLAYVSFEGSE